MKYRSFNGLSLIIFLKEVFSIQEFLNIEESLNLVNKNDFDNLLKVLKILSDENIFINNILNDNTKYQDLCQNIQDLYNFLFESLGDTDNFAKLMIDLLVHKIKKIKNENYHKKLFEIILSKHSLLIRSYPFIYFILKELIDAYPGFILKNLNILQKSNNLYLTIISKISNESLNEIILNAFESQFNSYFKSIPDLSEIELEEYFPKYFYFYKMHNKENKCLILLDESLNLFKDCLLFLERVYLGELKENNNELIWMIFCIAYIKMYLYKCIYYNHYKNQYFIDFELIYEAIEGNNKNVFRKMIKIYVFKIFFFILNNNYKDFINYHYPNHGIYFFEEFKEKFNGKIESMLNYYLLPIGIDYEKYQKVAGIFEDYIIMDFNKPTKQFKELIEKNGIDIFYTISSNLIISNLVLKNNALNSQYLYYSSFIKSLFDERLQIPEITKKLFLLFSNDDIYNEKMKPKITFQNNKEISQKTF